MLASHGVGNPGVGERLEVLLLIGRVQRRILNTANGLPGNFKFLVCRDHQQTDQARPGVYIEGPACGRGILVRIDGNPQCPQPATALLAHPGIVLANTPGKYHGIQPAQYGVIGTDIFFYAVTIHIQCQPAQRIAGLGQTMYFAHVISTADALQSAFPVEQGFDLVVVQAGSTSQIKMDRRVHHHSGCP